MKDFLEILFGTDGNDFDLDDLFWEKKPKKKHRETAFEDEHFCEYCGRPNEDCICDDCDDFYCENL